MKFDNTITMGNLLTAVAMLGAVSAVWSSNQERFAKVEARQDAAGSTDIRHDSELRDLKQDIKSGLGDIKSELRDLRQEVKGRR